MKGGRQRQEYRAQKQRNRIIAQLNQLHQQGFTTEDIRAAGKNAWATLNGTGSTTTTVADGDTVASVAAKTGTTPADLLNANPDVKTFKTGMVVNVPGSEGWRVQNAYKGPGAPIGKGGVGIPSAGAFGALAVPNNYNVQERGRSYGQAAPSMWNSGTALIGNTLPEGTPFNPTGSPLYNFAQQQRNKASTTFKSNGISITNSSPLSVPASAISEPATPNFTNAINALVNRTSTPSTTNNNYNAPAQFRPTFRTKDDSYPTQLRALIEKLNMTPNQDQLNYLIKQGMIQPPTPSYSGGGGYNYGRGGRGGGGGGGGKQTTPRQQQQSMPAFSSGAGFGGLVNWRI